MTRLGTLAPVLLMAAAPVLAQAPPPSPPPPLQSPDVHPDRRVTFRLRAPNAREVFLTREGAERAAMQKDDQGVWTVTTEPLEPDLYGYAFVADGVTLFDPSNPVIKPNFIYVSSLVHVPGPPSLPWEVGDVPHGAVHRHFYRSSVVGMTATSTSTRLPATIPWAGRGTPSCTSSTASATTPAAGPPWDAPTSFSTT